MRQAFALRAARELQLLHGDRMDVVFHGLSMDPLLFEGDRVVVEAVDVGDIVVGDVICYRHDDKYPARRVVARGADHFVLWCDAWPQLQFRADFESVLGRVVARTRNGHELAATSPEWLGRRDRALVTYRRARIGIEARRVARGLHRRLPPWGRSR